MDVNTIAYFDKPVHFIRITHAQGENQFVGIFIDKSSQQAKMLFQSHYQLDETLEFPMDEFANITYYEIKPDGTIRTDQKSV